MIPAPALYNQSVPKLENPKTHVLNKIPVIPWRCFTLHVVLKGSHETATATIDLILSTHTHEYG